MVIISWDLVYLGSSFTFQWGSDTALYFVKTVGGSSNLSNAGTLLIPTTICTLIIWIALWFISHKDLNDGIGKLSKILIPALFVIMAIIVIYALTLPGANIGIETLLKPDWTKLLDINIWLAGFSQIVFSLSMGQAIAFTYASYLPEKSKLNDNVLVVVFANSAFEVFTSFGIFSILGYMSYTTGTPMVQLVSQGTGLIFIVFPKIFNIMGIAGRILAPLLFVAILFAGISSAMGIFEPMVSSIESKFNWSRRKTVTVLSIIGCALSLLFTTGISSDLVGIVDGFVNEFGILLLIAIQCIIFTWIYAVDSLIPTLNENSRFKVGKTWKLIVKYVLPIFLIIMWVLGIFKLFANADSFTSAVDIIIIVAVLAFSVILTKIKPREN
jgi:NSS family neurotransmitter:Na+ symporter